MSEELMDILKEEYEEILEMPFEAVADHVYFNIILKEDFADLSNDFLDYLREWYSDYEYYIASGEADEDEIDTLVKDMIEHFKEYIFEE